MHQEGLQKAEVIGLEYGIERQTTKDIHLCLMAFQLFCGWLEFIWLFTLPLFRGQESGGGGGGQATGTGSGRRSGTQGWRSRGACAAAVCGCMNHKIPPKAQGSFV